MNRFSRTALSIAFVAGFASGCSSTVERAEPVAQADQIGVFQAGPPGPRSYVAVRRLWVDKWKSAFDVPHYASAEAGAADLRNQAVALGGNAIMNFGCYRLNPGATGSKPDFICNGTVVKFAD
jgi:hypothetical protein